MLRPLAAALSLAAAMLSACAERDKPRDEAPVEPAPAAAPTQMPRSPHPNFVGPNQKVIDIRKQIPKVGAPQQPGAVSESASAAPSAPVDAAK